MSKNKDIKIINEINRVLKSQYNDFKGTYFFGSRLKGNNLPDSDYDLLFVFDRDIDYSFKREIRDIIYDFMLRYDIVIDSKIFSEHSMKVPNMPFTEGVKQKGSYYAI